MDKTVKIRAYSEATTANVPQGNLTEDQNNAVELVKKSSQLEEEKQKSSEYLKTIEQLRDSLKQEQAKMAEIAKKATALNANDLAIKDAQLEEEKSRTLENLKTIVQLRESLKQEQASTAGMAQKITELESKINTSSTVAEELAIKSARLEEEKNKSLAQTQVVEQLQEKLHQQQVTLATAQDQLLELDTRGRALAAAEEKIKILDAALAQINDIVRAVG